MTITISGHVLDQGASQSLSGLRVEAWDAYLTINEPVASTFTGEQGSFQLHLEEAYLQGLSSQQQPELYFNVLRGDALLTDTQHSLTWCLGGVQSEIVIEMSTPADPDATVISPARLVASLPRPYPQTGPAPPVPSASLSTQQRQANAVALTPKPPVRTQRRTT